ncbi:MAG: hypothetical protein RBU23_08755 [Candidatus Auribacterota bacterium]|jgi:hypothetical protein|nr:hypothetical protein [Candidatus Auribacterota bacterium]
MKHKYLSSLNPVSWKSKKGRRIFFDIACIIVPLTVILGLLLLLHGLFSGKKESTEEMLRGWKKGVIAQRVFNARTVSAEVFLPILRNEVRWGAISVRFPYSWVHFFENRFGGRTLSLQESLDSNYGMHIQIEHVFKDTGSIFEFGASFLKNIGLYPQAHGEIDFLQAQGHLFFMRYTTREGIVMSSLFLFIRKENYLIKIIAYSPDSVYLARKSLFDAILTTIQWDETLSFQD